MRKVYISLALASSLAVGANAEVEVKPFGHVGGFYHQGLGNLPTFNNNGKEVQRAYANISARIGLDIGLGQNFSIGLGGWGAYPFYSTGPTNNKVGDIAIPRNGDVSDAYVRFDSGALSFALGRFDIGEFYFGKDGKDYTGVDWIYGNVQGGALKAGGEKLSLWAYWRNSGLGANQAYNRMGYELSSFHTYQGMKKGLYGNIGELAGAGIDIDFGAVKISPFASYLTDTATSISRIDTFNAGAKVQLELGGDNLKSITALRGVFNIYNPTGDSLVPTQSGLTLWIDEELRISEVFKLGAGYISQDKKVGMLNNFGDRTRFYGYRGGLNGPGVGNPFGLAGHSTWYVFGGVVHERFGLDLLYSGGDYEEMSAVGSLKIWKGDKAYFSVGGGYVGTKINSIINPRWQNSALAFAKFGF